MRAVQAVELRPTDKAGFCPRGGALAMWRCKAPECILSGPADTGKTWGCLYKIHSLAATKPNLQILIVRKTLESIYTSVLKSYKKILLSLPGQDPDEIAKIIVPYGGEKPQWYDYKHTGSQIYFAGMDNPSKALSSEWDLIYVNQCEQLDEEEWGTLSSRASGRAGHWVDTDQATGQRRPRAQILGDCNPDALTHWILHRPSIRPGVNFFESRHEDNPELYDDDGQITEAGKIRIAVLDALPGMLRDRLRYGRWGSVEGIVYKEFDRAVHLKPMFPIPPDWRRFRTIDFGYVNPFSSQWWAMNHDSDLFLYREIYYTKRTVRRHAADILRYSAYERMLATVADHDAEDRATLEEEGIPTIPAFKLIRPGIQAVEERLRIQGNGKPRLYILDGALVEEDPALVAAKKPKCTLDEIGVYSWPPGVSGKAGKEVPIDDNNHGMDNMRYAVAYADKIANLRYAFL